jgi:hypothetical protein
MATAPPRRFADGGLAFHVPSNRQVRRAKGRVPKPLRRGILIERGSAGCGGRPSHLLFE